MFVSNMFLSSPFDEVLSMRGIDETMEHDESNDETNDETKRRKEA